LHELNKFPLFDDDKPNDHIDIKAINKLVPKQVKPKYRQDCKELTQAKSNQNNHGHANLPPFGIIEKG